MDMTLDEAPRPRRRKRSRRKHRARKARRVTQVVGWSIVGIIMAAAFVIGAIYLLVTTTGVWSGS